MTTLRLYRSRALMVCGALLCLTLCAAIAGAATEAQQKALARVLKSNTAPYPTWGAVERNDSRLDHLLAEDAKLEKLAEGFAWSEGPAWNKEGAFLLFSDIPRNSVMKWKEGEGVSLFLKPSGFTGVGDYSFEPGSNGLAFDAQGRLVSCEHGDRRVSRLEKNGGKKTLADSYQGKRLNSPNDLTISAAGDIYFTDPPYGLPKQDDPSRELDFCGVYRIAGRDGSLSLVTDKMVRPNGIALSPDDKILYVAQSDSKEPIWMAFDVAADGSTSNGRKFVDGKPWADAGKKGGPDGMKVDKDGNLWATGPGGLCIIAPDGTLLGTIVTGQRTANCTFGGPDGSVLYMACDGDLARIKTLTKGKGW